MVDRPGDDFLAGAGLARDQNRARRPRDGLEHVKQIAHGAAAADDALEAVALLELLPQPGVFAAQAPLLDGALQRVPELVELERLGDEVGRAALDDLDRVPDRAIAGHHDADNLGVALDRRLDDPRAVHPGQPEVGDDDVERELGQGFERPLGRVCLDDVHTTVCQLLSQSLAEGRFVFDEQQMFRRISHL